MDVVAAVVSDEQPPEVSQAKVRSMTQRARSRPEQCHSSRRR
jgi:hypothetical protein